MPTRVEFVYCMHSKSGPAYENPMHMRMFNPSSSNDFLYTNFLIKISQPIVIELFYFFSEYFYNETTKSISIPFFLLSIYISLFLICSIFSRVCERKKIRRGREAPAHHENHHRSSKYLLIKRYFHTAIYCQIYLVWVILFMFSSEPDWRYPIKSYGYN